MKTKPLFSDLLNLPSMTLCTVNPQTIPHAAALYFVADEHLSLYFLSASSSQHIQDLAQNQRAAITIEPTVEKWQEIHGLQMRGLVSELPNGFQSVASWARYLAKFPFVKNFEVEILKNRFYVFKPDWMRLVDNRVRFGYKQEWSGSELVHLCEGQ